MKPLLLTILLLGLTCSAQDDKDTIKVSVKLVSVFATVTDQSGAPITDLKKDQFTVAEDGVPQNISVFEQESAVPLSIVLQIDASQSVHKDLKLELDSARRFVSSILRKQDQLALYQFNESVDELVPFTNDFQKISRGIRDVHIGASTAMYDAIYLGGAALLDRQGRKVMVIITDGGDTTSKVRYPEALRAMQQAEAIVYPIIMVPITASAGRDLGGEHALIQLAKDTGGKYYYADTLQALDVAFQQISKELRTQYLLGYYPKQRLANSDFRAIEVAVKPLARANSADEATYNVRHRAGYYTSKLY